MLETLVNNYVVGDINSWINNVGQMVLGIVAGVVGIFLVVRAFLDLREGLGKATKDWGKAAVGLLVGAIGGFIMFWSVGSIIEFFKNAGNSIPKS